MDNRAAFSTLTAVYGFQNDLYAEWLLMGDKGTRPCRFKNWDKEDLAAYCGGEYTKGYVMKRETEWQSASD
jgi:hypothetical protein